MSIFFEAINFVVCHVDKTACGHFEKKQPLWWLLCNNHFKFNQSVQRIFNHCKSQEKLETMLMQNVGYRQRVLWYIPKWPIDHIWRQNVVRTSVTFHSITELTHKNMESINILNNYLPKVRWIIILCIGWLFKKWAFSLKQLISSSVTLTKQLAAILKKNNRFGDYCVIITSSSTNQCREFSIITYVIIIIKFC